MTLKQALTFVKTNGITLESGRGPVPSLAQTIAGETIRGSWWAHPKGHVIFLCSRAIRESEDVLVCRLVGGKVTYVHRRLWPALVREFGDILRLCSPYVRCERSSHNGIRGIRAASG